MLAAARREAYEIPFGGRAQFQYAADVAARFIAVARAAVRDAVVLNIGGRSERVTDVVAAIEAVAPEGAGKVTVKQDALLPLPEDMEGPPTIATPLRQGVLETIELFRRARR